jgi:histidinol-phosphate aminotransferase
MSSWVIERARPDILALSPYSHAAWEPSLTRLHANELPWRVAGDASQAGLNRYPEPQPPALVNGLARLYAVQPEQLLVGRGSDEAIDVLLRVFCRAGIDNVVICPPTFGMYAVAARIQGAEVRSVPLRPENGFAFDVDAVLAQVDDNTKLVFACTPNNPTGNAVPTALLIDLARRLAPRALLVVDEAYIDFSNTDSLCQQLAALPNLAVLKTLSKAHGLAGARVGALIAAPEIIALTRKVIPPYAITELTVEAVAPLLQEPALRVMRDQVKQLLLERIRLAAALAGNRFITHVWPSDTNFLLVDCTDPDEVLKRIRTAGLIIRDVRKSGLPQSLRITVGTPEQNDRVLESLK